MLPYYGGLICLGGSELNMTTNKCDCVSTVLPGPYSTRIQAGTSLLHRGCHGRRVFRCAQPQCTLQLCALAAAAWLLPFQSSTIVDLLH
ncbi:hypothetical protein DPMN_045011 [Dreissena polymorpha]|uniref:Uncharacterized protein n=1 Tax=Dreissena polymorpha TaxID=45954 RepID=A0A9D4D412_DREPO|nr:hypothetical protein DPMN_045011 [Dreissena polymorpha]